ncbi:MAG TPA: zinc ribbon domain-containing protein [Pyrinomonadaceae bacterium]|jgi:hypothetical protein
MYCPKCSQEQISDETRFCSRCGFQLNVVKALLSEDGLPQSPEIQKTDRSLRKRDLTIGAALMFFFALVVAAVTVELPPGHSNRIVALVVAWLLLSLLINVKPIVEYFMRGDNGGRGERNLSSKPVSNFSTSERQNSGLPSAQSIPVDLVMPGANTAEMIHHSSVTESTTNLLNK